MLARKAGLITYVYARSALRAPRGAAGPVRSAGVLHAGGDALDGDDHRVLQLAELIGPLGQLGARLPEATGEVRDFEVGRAEELRPTRQTAKLLGCRSG